MDQYIILQNLRQMKGEVEYVKAYLTKLDTKLDTLIEELEKEETKRWAEPKNLQQNNTLNGGSET